MYHFEKKPSPHYQTGWANLQLAFVILSFLALQLFSEKGLSLDNPDAPDYVAQFELSAKNLESEISKQEKEANSIKLQTKYNEFLNKELSEAYKKLLGHLSESSKDRLKKSQQQWLKFRDFEYSFIAKEWTAESFGTSSTLTKYQMQGDVTKARVIELYQYLKNYSH